MIWSVYNKLATVHGGDCFEVTASQFINSNLFKRSTEVFR